MLRDLPAAPRRQLLIILMMVDEVPSALAELCGGDPLLGPLVRASLAEAIVVRDLPLAGLDSEEGVDDQTAAVMMSVVHGLAWRDAELPPAERDVLVGTLSPAPSSTSTLPCSEDVDPDYWSLLDEGTVLRMQGSAHPEADVVVAAIATDTRRGGSARRRRRCCTSGRWRPEFDDARGAAGPACSAQRTFTACDDTRSARIRAPYGVDERADRVQSRQIST